MHSTRLGTALVPSRLCTLIAVQDRHCFLLLTHLTDFIGPINIRTGHMKDAEGALLPPMTPNTPQRKHPLHPGFLWVM